jgi:hypothetical protein
MSEVQRDTVGVALKRFALVEAVDGTLRLAMVEVGDGAVREIRLTVWNLEYPTHG